MDTLTFLLAAPCALFFLLMGLAALSRPGRLLRGFGIGVETADARNEIRAVYGGFGVGMALLLAGGMAQSALLPGIALTLAAAMAGMALGRLISAAADRHFGRLPQCFFGVELLLAVALCGVFLRSGVPA